MTEHDRDRRAGRLRLPPRRAREPDRLPAAAAALAQGRVVRDAQRARPREVQARPVPARLDERGLRRPAGAPAARDLLGQREPDRPARRLRRGEALRRGADDGLPPPAGRRTRRSSGSSTPTARACAPHDGRAIPTFVRQALENKPLTVFGDGSQTRSFCYVDDLIRGLYLLADERRAPAGQPRQPERVHHPRAGREGDPGHRLDERDRLRGAPVDDPQIRQPDITRARQMLGWEPEIELEEGLRRMLPTRPGAGQCVGRARRRCVGDALSPARRRRRATAASASRAHARRASSTSRRRSREPGLGVPAVQDARRQGAAHQPLLGRAERRRASEAARRTRATRPTRPTTGRSTTARSSARPRTTSRSLFSILGTPGWANGAASRTALRRSTIDLRNFAYAAAKRYSGSFHPTPTAAPLPAVALWLAWNEPNNPVFLRPQFQQVGAGATSLAEPVASTRGSATRSMRASTDRPHRREGRPAASRLRAETTPADAAAPLGLAAGFLARHEAGAAPLRRLRPSPVLRHADRVAERSRRRGPRAVTLGNIDELITRADAALRQRSASGSPSTATRRTRPTGSSASRWAKQARYLAQAYAIARRNPRIDMMLWFLLQGRGAHRERLAVRALHGLGPAQADATRRSGASPK